MISNMNVFAPLLLVEDNEDDELLTLRAFARAGFANPIVVVRDGQEALDWLFRKGGHRDRTDPLRPGVVLLDLQLPKVDGLGVLRAIRADPRTALLPVVVLTSSAEQRDLVESYRLGCNGYVQKPVDFLEFVGAAHAVGTYWLLLNRLPDDASG